MEKEQPKKSSRKPWSYGMIVAFLLMIILLPPLLHLFAGGGVILVALLLMALVFLTQKSFVLPLAFRYL